MTDDTIHLFDFDASHGATTRVPGRVEHLHRGRNNSTTRICYDPKGKPETVLTIVRGGDMDIIPDGWRVVATGRLVDGREIELYAARESTFVRVLTIALLLLWIVACVLYALYGESLPGWNYETTHPQVDSVRTNK